MKYLCGELDAAAGIVRGQNVRSLSDLVQLYNSVGLQAILPSTTTDLSRVRRADELNWRHAAEVMKKRGRVEG
jgi:hypothetical protein